MAERLRRALERAEKATDRLKQRHNSTTVNYRHIQRIEGKISLLEDQLYGLAAEQDLKYPMRAHLILPTRFGNILRSAETYSNDRYNIDGVVLWPRLVSVMPDKYYERLERNNNDLAFLINCATLSMVLAMLCLLASFYQLWLAQLRTNGQSTPPLLYFISINETPDIYLQRAALYLILTVVLLISFRALYNATIPVLTRYGNLVRSSYDLFRFDLLTALKIEKPTTSLEERRLWLDISKFLTFGRFFDEYDFPYQFAPETPAKTGDAD